MLMPMLVVPVVICMPMLVRWIIAAAVLVVSVLVPVPVPVIVVAVLFVAVFGHICLLRAVGARTTAQHRCFVAAAILYVSWAPTYNKYVRVGAYSARARRVP